MTNSTTRYRHRVRCTRPSICGHRMTFKKKPIVADLSCPMCGGNVRSVEADRKREMAKQDTCYCHGIPFIHKKGSILGCHHHPKHPDDWTTDDDRQYQSMMEVPRSG